jgi:peptidoglycan-N-acetylglucosamine deacetylase
MRSIRVCGLALGMLLAGASAPSLAEDACKPGPNVLGVSRTIEIDTSTGPRFGSQYNKAEDILADGEVVLTFDDGPSRAYTKPVLEALEKQCTKATFFLVGRMAVADPEMVKEYAKRGHTIGAHTWSHANLQAMSSVRARAEIELGFSAVQHALGKPLAPFFRFPYLRDTRAATTYLQGRQVAMFSIDIDSKDYRTTNPSTVRHKVIADLARQRKGIILFHDIQVSTARALPGLLADLKAKGYRIVHLKPKATLATVPEYDALAEQEFSGQRRVASHHPLAKRAFPWSLTGPGEPAAAKAHDRPEPHGRTNDWPSTIWR